jgi:hypothetical protein|tara:strand:+ start:1027 stop:1248 length:222 start_codon:yes stop_codon:yes gene_type:complete
MEYVIEKNSPVPPHPTKGSGKWQKLLSMMEVNDTTLVKSEDEVRGIRTSAYKMGMKIKSRRISDNEYWVQRVK